MTVSLVSIALLIAFSAFFSIAEIAVAAARRLRLQQLSDEGDDRAAAALRVQLRPGSYFTVVLICQNVIAILGGVVGESTLTPSMSALLANVASPDAAGTLGSLLSFLLVTSLFILFSDLLPKRVGMAQPERLAVGVMKPMQWAMALLRPVVWVFNGVADGLSRLFGLPERRDESVTPADILALAEAGAQAGVLDLGEQRVIENLFELDTRNVESAMTPRDRIVYFLLDDDEETIRTRIAAEPHSTYLVCDKTIDHVVGYLDAADLFARMLKHEPISLRGDGAEGLVQKALMVPDRLTLSEILAQFRQARDDFAVIVNEYGLVVGIITLNDVMSTVMGSLVAPGEDAQIVQRGDGTWLMDGLTPIVDVVRTLGLDPGSLPQRGQYDTLAGFLMVMLRRIPRRTDCAVWQGHRFEVVDVDSIRIDQVLVSRLPAETAPVA